MVTVRCYNKEETWSSRSEAMKFYFTGMIMTDGSERERYTSIYCQLAEGRNYCSDEV